MKITRSLHHKKIQFYGCKQVFYFDKSRKIPLEKFPPEKNPPENISDNFVKFRKFFLTGEDFRKFRGKYHKILIIKSIIYRLQTSVYTFLSQCCPECFRKLPGNFSGNFLSRWQLVTTEIIGRLHINKIQFYGCKQVFYFDKPRKVPQGKFPPEKNLPENISGSFVKFQKFFPTGGYLGKFRGKFYE